MLWIPICLQKKYLYVIIITDLIIFNHRMKIEKKEEKKKTSLKCDDNTSEMFTSGILCTQ